MNKFEIRSPIRQNDGGQEFEICRMVAGMAGATGATISKPKCSNDQNEKESRISQILAD